MIVEDFEKAWMTGRPEIEPFFHRHPSRPLRLLVELAAIDMENRTKRGEDAKPRQYEAAYPLLAADPACVAELRRAHAHGGLDMTTNHEQGHDDSFGLSPAHDADEGLAFLQPPTAPGTLGTLAHYTVIRRVGQGAFGSVYEAFDEKLHRRVAIKVLSPQLATTSPPRKRFVREARSMAAVSHENVVRVYAVEEQPVPYLVMEFVDGQTLQDRMDRGGPFDASEVVHISRQVAAALAAAHETGLIHRDIKPSNVLLERGPGHVVKLTDFGLARAADDASMTGTGTLLGTPLYMSPEQADGGTIDHRTDLFSLGSLMYVMISGRAPFRASSITGVLKRLVDDTPRPIGEIIPETPHWLVDLISRLHAKKPAERMQTAREVERILAAAQSGTIVHDLPAAAAPAVPPSRPSARSAAAPPARTSTIGPWVAGTLVAAGCMAVGWLGWWSLGPDALPAANRRATPAGTNVRGVAAAAAASVRGPQPAWQPGGRRQFDTFVERRRHLEEIPGIIADPTILPGIARWQVIPRLPTCEISGIDASPRGPIVVGSCDGLVRVFDPDGMRLLHVLGPHGRGPYVHAAVNVAYSPDGSWLATAGFDGVRFWNADTGRSTDLVPLEADAGVHAVDWHPSGSMVAVSIGAEVILITAPDKEGRPEIAARWRNKEDNWTRGDGLASVRDVAWSPDGTRLACVGYDRPDQRLKTIGAVMLDATATPVVTIPEAIASSPRCDNCSVAWNPAGDRIAIGSKGGAVTVFPLSGGEPATLVAEDTYGPQANVLRWHPDGDRLLCGFNSQLILLHARNRDIKGAVLEEECRFPRSSCAKCLAIATDGETYIYPRFGHDLRHRRFADNTLVFDAAYPREHISAASDALRWSADGRLVLATGCGPHSIRVVAADGRVVAGPWTTKLSRTAAGVRLQPHPTDGNVLAMHSQDGQAAIVSIDGRRQSVLTADDDYRSCGTAWILGGERLALGRMGSAELSIYDAQAFAYPPIQLPQPLSAPTIHSRFMPLASASAATGSLIGAATGDEGLLTLYRLDAAGRPGAKPIRTQLTQCQQVAIDASGRWAAARYAEDRRFAVLDVAEDSLHTFDEHLWTIGDIDWSSRGPTLISAGWDGRCFIWNPETDERRCFETVNDMFVSASADPVTGFVAVKTAGNVVHCFDPESLSVRWSLTTLPEDGQATFSAGGAFLHGDIGLVEKHLAVVVDHDDGRRDVITHGDFLELAKVARDPATAAAARPRPGPSGMVDAAAAAVPIIPRGEDAPRGPQQPPPAPPSDRQEWPPGPTLQELPGLVTNPTLIPGVDRWQVMPKMPNHPLAGIDFGAGGRLAVASRDGLVRMYDSASMEPIDVLGPHRRTPTGDAGVAVRFSPDGEWLASAGHDGVRFWNSTTRLSSGIAVGDGSGPTAIAWRTDGQRIAVACGREVIFVGVPAAGRLPKILARWDATGRQDGLRGVWDVSWSPDGSQVACVGFPRADQAGRTTGVILLRDDGTCLGSLPESDAAAPHIDNTSVAWSPDGSRIAVGSYNGGVQIIPIDGSPPVQLVADRTFGVHAEVLRWHPDGRSLICGTDHEILRIDTLNAGSRPLQLARDVALPHQSAPQSLAVSPDGQWFAYAAGSHRLRIVRFADGASVFAADHPREYPNSHWRDNLRWSADGRIVVATGGEPHVVRVVTADGTVVGKPWKVTLAGGGLRLQPHPTDGVTFAAHTFAGDVGILAVDQQRLSSFAVSGNGPPRAVGWMPDGNQLAVASRDSPELALFDRTGATAGRIMLSQPLSAYYETMPFAIAGSNTEPRFGVAGKEGVATLIRADATREVLSTQPISSDQKHCRDVAISPDGEWMAALYRDANTQVFASRPAAGPAATFKGHGWWVGDISWAHRDTTLVSAGFDGRCFTWNPRTNESRCFDRHAAHDVFLSAAADPVSGRIAVKTLGNVIHCVAPKTLAPLWSLAVLSDESHAAFSPGGTLLHGEPSLAETQLIYVVDHKDGRREILSHGGFFAFAESARSRVNEPQQPLPEEGFESLFNGRDLAGWQGATDAYEVVNGELCSKPGGRGNLFTTSECDDFVLRFEFRLTPGANNGIGIRAPLEGDPAYEGLELQILDQDWHGGIQPWQGHGSIYGVAAAARGCLRPAGEWNSEEITARGPRISVTVNGERILDTDISTFRAGQATPDGKTHPGLSRLTGHVGLLGHGDVVRFRNIRIRASTGATDNTEGR